jgi:hypothetical protein
VGAYVLAGELLKAGGDHRVAFREYERQLRGYAQVTRKGNAGPFLAPPSRLRIAMRNQMFRSGFLFKAMLKLIDRLATGIELQDYEAFSRH